MKLSWKDVLNTEHGLFSHIDIALGLAHRAGYQYMTWNGRVYTVVLSGADLVEARQTMFKDRQLRVGDIT